MWRHGISDFLDFLNRRSPESWEFMATFIPLAYSMMSLLDETSLRSPYDWIHSKGRLAHFRYVEALPLLRRIDVLTETGNCRGRWVVPNKKKNNKQHKKNDTQKQNTQAQNNKPTSGLLY